jgi:GDP-4-dehydro-6-deoxy-D-mannose reductase
MRRVLVTGVTGFAGSHLVDYMLGRGDCEIVGIHRWRSRTENIEHFMDRISLTECDLRDASSTRDMLEKVRPDWIFHLAAQSFVPTSWTAPSESLTTNILGQVNLFEAVRRLKLPCRIQLACSSEEYGMVYPDEVPIRETNPLRPLSPYAVSKVAQDLMGYQYARSYGLHVVRARAFNHTGPRRGEHFATSNFAKQVAEIEAGLREPVVRVGDLTPTRDFSDVRDVIRGYWLLLERGTPGEVYNLCSGVDWSIERVLQFFIARAKVSQIRIEVDPARLRPSDVPALRGSAEKAHAATGWRPEIPLEQTLSELLDYWRQRTQAATARGD